MHVSGFHVAAVYVAFMSLLVRPEMGRSRSIRFKEVVMLDAAQLFQDSTSITKAIIESNESVDQAMQRAFAYCSDIAPEYQQLWSELSGLDFLSGNAALMEWIVKLLQEEPPSPSINALRFGLYNPGSEDGGDSCDLYCSGSSRFDAKDPHTEWFCAPEYWPDGRYANSKVMELLCRDVDQLDGVASYLGEAVLCHAYVAAVLVSWCNGELSGVLKGVEGTRVVAFGHDDGDTYFISNGCSK